MPPDEKLFASRLMTARSLQDVSDLLKMADAIYGPHALRPVGDRPNNSGTIRVGSEPALGVVERTVNMIDALLDLAHLDHPHDAPTSPRHAGQMWFGVPGTGLADMSDAQRRTLGERLQVWLDESGDPKRPTVVFDDRGTGQSPEKFPRTLLSLNQENKVGQSWTSGTYGQGGAVCFGFSEATVIISRRHPGHPDGKDRVGWTIVRRIEDPAAQALPNYQYVVGTDHEVFSLSPDLFPEFPHGTRVIHVAYDLQGWTGPYTTGLWQFLNAAMFDPVLPFLVSGKRKKEESYGTRIITGNASRLDRPEKARGDLDVAHRDSVHFKLSDRLGSVVFNYWVLRRPPESDSTSDAAGSYVRADSAVSMTLFGQRQDAMPRAWIKDQARLPFLYKGMVVQVSADGLTPVAKSEVFASTRERATKSDTLSRIYDQLAYVLRNDDVLAELNREEKERLLAKSTSAVSDKIRKRLANFVKTKLKNVTKTGDAGGASGGDHRPKKESGTRSKRSTDDQHLGHVPTRLRFVVLDKSGGFRKRTEPLRIAQGGSSVIWVEVDAKNGYLPDHNDDLTLSWSGASPGESIRLALQSRLLGGLTRWSFEVAADAALGDYVLEATLITVNGVLSDTQAVTVIAPPTTKPSGKKGEEPETGPEVVWVYKEQWDAHNGMDAKTVGYVTVDDEQTIIWLNRNFAALEKALAGRNLTEEAMETRLSRYQFPIACALWLQHHEISSTNPRPDERYEKAEKERLAEAVLVAIDPDVDVAMTESED